MAPAVDQDGADPPRTQVVAIGASAGGIASLRALLSGLPKDFPAPVLVVLHLDREHPSQAAAILQRGCELQVKPAKEGDVVAAGTVYVGQPDRHLEVEGGRIQLTTSPPENFSRPSINRLFESVANAYGEGVVAVVLSGLGSDGADGIRKVKEHDGTTLVEGGTAAHPEMAQAALRTGAVDVALPVGDIPAFLLRCLQAERAKIPRGSWDALLRLLRARFGTDFSGYRTTTLHRRLATRLHARGQPDLDSYLRLVRSDPEELARLHSAFLIKVSSFFRDSASWERLRSALAEPLRQRAAEGHPVRAWSAGCATGEEAYSLAILLLETVPPEARDDLRVFATDVDLEAVDRARRGVYDERQLKNVPEALRQRYFLREGPQYRVSKDLRKHVILGRHDLTKDPPIANLDVVTCRNLLIYFDKEQKAQVLARLAFAVRPGGLLFLGKSEGIEGTGAAFEALSQHDRVFAKVAARHAPALPLGRGPSSPPGLDLGSHRELGAAVRGGERDLRAQEAFEHLLLESATQLLAMIDREGRLALWNQSAERFFGLPAEEALGRPLYEATRGLSAEALSSGMQRCLAELDTVHTRDVPFLREGQPQRYLDLDFIPVKGFAGRVLLVGVDVTGRHEAEARQKELLEKLRRAMDELSRSNLALQATNEELETLNEELQSASEEQQTLNEELQSGKEELETLNEELQSTNEELGTVNEELRLQGAEVERLAAYTQGLLDASADALLACDAEGSVSFWSRSATQTFKVSPAKAVGKDFFELLPHLEDPQVREAMRLALRGDIAVVESSPEVPGSGVFRLAFSPIRDERGTVRGFVVNAADVTQRSRREEALAASERLFRALAEGSPDPMLLISGAEDVRSVNPAAQAYFGLLAAAPVAPGLDQGPPEGGSPSPSAAHAPPPKGPAKLRDLLADPEAVSLARRQGTEGNVGLEVEVRTPRGLRRCNVTVSLIGDSQPPLRLAVFRDVTDRRAAEQQVVHDRDLVTIYNRILTHDIGNFATALSLQAELAEKATEEEVRKRMHAIQGVLERLRGLIKNAQLLNELGGERKVRPVDGTAALADALAAASKAYPDRNVRLINNGETGLFVHADPQLTQVFYNLIANAIQYNPRTDCLVEVASTASSLGGEPAITWSIADNGKGFPEHTRKRFLGARGAPPTSGHGIGLEIVRGLLDLWGGKVELADRVPGDPSKGAVVRLTLRRAETVPAPNGNAGGRPPRR